MDNAVRVQERQCVQGFGGHAKLVLVCRILLKRTGQRPTPAIGITRRGQPSHLRDVDEAHEVWMCTVEQPQHHHLAGCRSRCLLPPSVMPLYRRPPSLAPSASSSQNVLTAYSWPSSSRPGRPGHYAPLPKCSRGSSCAPAKRATPFQALLSERAPSPLIYPSS